MAKVHVCILVVAGLCLVQVSPGPVLHAQQDFGIDHSLASVDGKVGVGFWPRDQNGQPIDVGDCRVRLMVDQEEDLSRAFPCGAWFSPPPGRYRLFLETTTMIAPYTTIMKYSGSAYQGRGVYGVQEMVPGGRLRLSSGVAFRDRTSLRLLHLDSHYRGQRYPQREMVRRVGGADAHQGVLMPEGSVIAALYDSAEERYLAISRPIEVVADETTVFAPKVPGKGRGDLLAVVERGQVIASFIEDDLRPLLKIGSTDRQPDVLVPTAERIYAVWYDLAAGSYQIRVDSAIGPHPPTELRVSPGTVRHIQLRASRE